MEESTHPLRYVIHTKLTFTKSKLSQMDTTNPSSWFTTIKQIAGMDKKKGSISIPGHEKNTADELASGINHHFGAICSTLPSLNTAQLPAYLPSATPPPTITRSQAWKELSKVKAHNIRPQAQTTCLIKCLNGSLLRSANRSVTS